MIRSAKTGALHTLQRRRTNDGTSLTELLVSVLIIGIAIAGLSEAAWLNTAWANLVQHKLDNQFNCKTFLTRIGKEIQLASSIQTNSNDTVLTIANSDTLNLNYKSITYTTELSPSSTSEYQIKRQEKDYTKKIVSEGIVLSGIIGPFKQNNISIFSYVDRLTGSPPNVTDAENIIPKNVSAAPTSYGNTAIVIIDLDLASNNAATSRGAFGGPSLTKSAYSIRREFFLRNSNPHG